MTFVNCLYKRATHWVGVLGHLLTSWRFLALAAGLTLAACSGSDSGFDQNSTPTIPRPQLGAPGGPVMGSLGVALPNAVAPATPFGFVGSQFQSYTVPATGWYFLDAQGAQGGAASNGSHQGGKGARMQGYAYLQQGTVLRIAVGGAGGVGQNDGNNVSGGGGGGASSIVLSSGSVETLSSSDIPLLIAGGGGGAAANYDGFPGLTSERAGPPNEGVDGNGAGVGADSYGGAGGAGYRTDGGTQFEGNIATSLRLLSYGGQAYLSGNSGGASPNRGGDGGWGGGGEGGPAVSGLTRNRDGGGGGGGGYSGGGGGANQGDGAGGGGSYVSGDVNTTLSLAVAGYRGGDGVVTITPVSAAPVITQPANQQVAIGQAVTLGPVYDDPTGQTTYQWMKDGVVLVGQTSATLTIAPFKFTDSGGYQAIVQQGAATSITQPAFLSPSTPLATLQAWGLNDKGALGLGDNSNRSSPVQVTSDVVAMAAGYKHTLFVKRDGTLWAMGLNDFGQLGLGDNSDRSSPAQVTSDVVAVAAGYKHSLFVKRDGTLWAMGDNAVGQLGRGDTNAYSGRILPVQVTSDVVAVATGYYHSLFVKRDGTLWAMGLNTAGQLGLGDTNNRIWPVQVASDVVAAAGGVNYTLFVKRDGTLWSMGQNSYGQLGLGDTTDRNLPVQVTTGVVAVAAEFSYSLFVKRDGTLWGVGGNTSPVQVSSDVVAVAAGSIHILFVKRDGTLWAMGRNPYGQLGLGDTTDRTSPEQVFFRNSANQPTTALVVATLPKMPSSSHTLAITAPGP